MEKILLIGGWTRDEKSYSGLINLKPEGVKIMFYPCWDIIHKAPELSAEKLHEFLKSENFSPDTIIAHSLGGIIALEFALKYPTELGRLILIDSAGLSVGQTFWTKAIKAISAQRQFWRHKLKENIATTKRFFKRPVKNIQSMSLAYNHDLANRMKDIFCATDIVWGELDYIYPIDQAKKMQKLIPASNLYVLKKMDHDWIIHTPELFWKTLSFDIKNE